MAIWTVCEARGSAFRATTYELLSRARQVAAAAGIDSVAVVMGADTALADQLNGQAQQVLCLQGSHLVGGDAGVWSAALASACKPAPPRLVLFADSDRSREVAPALAARLGYAALANGTGLDWDADQFVLTRPVYGGKAYASYGTGDAGCVAVFRPNSFSTEPGDVATTQVRTVAVDPAPSRVRVEALQPRAGGQVPLGEAQVVVCGGRGMKAAENLALLGELAKVLDGAVGVSRAVVDAGWAEHSAQVGKSGKTVSPGLYIVAGVSGAVHHTMGMDTAKVVVAINTDPNAPIFRYADYGVVGNALEVLPALTAALAAQG
ncbi:MAG: electron transfer flavoprotein subunit alpha/FixB family protein [Deferrisomatales bacterium]|nr:electron transfer flavoprotein subunit alpha/FixB family protein [Deferrisomatales bacterium]